MALPQLNDVPKYDLVIPSTGQNVTFRPFLVKEQKVLLLALESGDERQILRAIIDTIKHCLVDDVNVDKLATFDIEYIFTQIRSKSAGETSKVNLRCSSCEQYTESVINLEDISIDVNLTNKHIVLNDKYTVVMRYPNYQGILLNVESDDSSFTAALFEMVVMCLDELRTEDEIIKFDDETRESIDSFLEGLTAGQLESMINFVRDLPKLQHSVEFNCDNCQAPNNVTLQGIQDFF